MKKKSTHLKYPFIDTVLNRFDLFKYYLKTEQLKAETECKNTKKN